MEINRIIAIDPGSQKSALVFLDKLGNISFNDKVENKDVLFVLSHQSSLSADARNFCDAIVIEQIAGMGMTAGADLFETCVWSGRFIQRWLDTVGRPWFRIPRREVKLELCNTSRANDKIIRQTIIDLYGGDLVAIGGKRCSNCKGKGWKGRERIPCFCCAETGYESPPGVLKGIRSDEWQALAAGLAWWTIANRASKEER